MQRNQVSPVDWQGGRVVASPPSPPTTTKAQIPKALKKKGKELVPIWGLSMEDMKWFWHILLVLFYALMYLWGNGEMNMSLIEKIDDAVLVAVAVAFVGVLTWKVWVRPLFQHFLKIAPKITTKEPPEEIRLEIYEDGFGDGYKTGQEHGEMTGYDEGHMAGYGCGHEEGYAEGHEAGVKKGTKRGRWLQKMEQKEDLPF